MESFGPLKLIRSGFWLGIGFVVPVAIAFLAGSALMFAMPSFWQAQGSEMAEKMMSEFDKTANVRVHEYKEVPDGDRVLILGTVENAGPVAVGSIELEAELFNENKQFVFECSESISRKLKPGEKENFQIRCGGGCRNQSVPAHASTTVRVVRATTF